jgi:hypothetical protein
VCDDCHYYTWRSTKYGWAATGKINTTSEKLYELLERPSHAYMYAIIVVLGSGIIWLVLTTFRALGNAEVADAQFIVGGAVIGAALVALIARVHLLLLRRNYFVPRHIYKPYAKERQERELRETLAETEARKNRRGR